ncbi:hypothetical protein P4O66_015331, partial [Electrophorus voltai]
MNLKISSMHRGRPPVSAGRLGDERFLLSWLPAAGRPGGSISNNGKNTYGSEAARLATWSAGDSSELNTPKMVASKRQQSVQSNPGAPRQESVRSNPGAYRDRSQCGATQDLPETGVSAEQPGSFQRQESVRSNPGASRDRSNVKPSCHGSASTTDELSKYVVGDSVPVPVPGARDAAKSVPVPVPGTRDTAKSVPVQVPGVRDTANSVLVPVPTTRNATRPEPVSKRCHLALSSSRSWRGGCRPARCSPWHERCRPARSSPQQERPCPTVSSPQCERHRPSCSCSQPSGCLATQEVSQSVLVPCVRSVPVGAPLALPAAPLTPVATPPDPVVPLSSATPSSDLLDPPLRGAAAPPNPPPLKALAAPLDLPATLLTAKAMEAIPLDLMGLPVTEVAAHLLLPGAGSAPAVGRDLPTVAAALLDPQLDSMPRVEDPALPVPVSGTEIIAPSAPAPGVEEVTLPIPVPRTRPVPKPRTRPAPVAAPRDSPVAPVAATAVPPKTFGTPSTMRDICFIQRKRSTIMHVGNSNAFSITDSQSPSGREKEEEDTGGDAIMPPPCVSAPFTLNEVTRRRQVTENPWQ